MPKSKKRHHSHQPQHHDTPVNKPAIIKTNQTVKVGIIFFSILGLLISYLIAGPDIIWLTAGTATGAIAGYFVGKQITKAPTK